MIVCSDLHFNKNNFEVVGKVLQDALQLARETNAPLACLGDINDTKANMRGEWVNLLVNLLSEYSDVEILMLVGNHDLLNIKDDKAHTLTFLAEKQNVKIFDNSLPAESRIYKNIGWIPYKNDVTEIWNDIEIFKKCGVDILFMHQGIQGGLQNAGRVDEDGVPTHKLAGFKIFSGHYHLPHTLEDTDIMYVGSSLSHSWGESNQEKYLLDLDSDTGIYEKIPAKAPKHITYLITPKQEPELDLHGDQDYIRVILRGPRDWVKDYDKALLKSRFNCDIKILSEYTNIDERVEIDKAIPNDEIIEKFVSAQTINESMKRQVILSGLKILKDIDENKKC